MRAQFIGTYLAILVAGAVAASTASAQCTYSEPSSQILTNTSGDSFGASVSFSGITGAAGYQFRKGGNGFGDFGPWTLSTSGSGSGGWFTQNSSGNGSGSDGNHIGYSWGLWANSGELVNATRLFSPSSHGGDGYAINPVEGSFPPMALPVGVTFQIDMDNGYISSGDSTGIGLQDAEGDTLWEWYFAGGGSTYTYHDAAGYNSSSLGWTDQGMTIAFTLTSTNTYSATITPVSGSGSITVSGTLISNSNSDNSVVQSRAWNYSAGSGSAYDFFVNNISILDKSDNAYTSTYLSPRSWTNSDGSGWDLATTGPNAGFFNGSAGFGFGAAVATTDNSWGLYASSGDVADAIRPFGQPVYVGNSVYLVMQNGDIQSGGTVGFGLQSGATNRFEFYFSGGNTDYMVNDGSGSGRDTGIGWTNGQLLIQFTLTSSNAYSLSVTPYLGTSSSMVTGSLEGVANTLIDRVRLFNADAGSGSAYDLNFSFLAVGSTVSPNLSYPLWMFGANKVASIKYDQSSFGFGFYSGLDSGYSILSVESDIGLEGETVPYYVGSISYSGGKELEGCYDLITSGCNNLTPWYIQVFNQ